MACLADVVRDSQNVEIWETMACLMGAGLLCGFQLCRDEGQDEGRRSDIYQGPAYFCAIAVEYRPCFSVLRNYSTLKAEGDHRVHEGSVDAARRL
jgi:hypothetical protein